MARKYSREDCLQLIQHYANISDIIAEEIEVKKKARKSARKAKETKEKIEETVKDAVEEKVAAEEIEVKKKARKAGKAIKKAAGIPNIIIQSPMGGYITPEDIAKKVPKNTVDVYVKVDENKLYYVLKNGKTGDVDIWD